ncbi:magnesium transporter CorA family protein [Treponema zioleckii]|uniref:magnesium transporter CorA family protein n=1 Tax=Treponema zioleckii TaxID=331680 RepID=UPI00168AC52E|nr:magnesium transporter CorA family protein [Treponema zioleckii]
MINYWQQDGLQLIRKAKEEIDANEKIWIDARNITQDEIKQLQFEYNLDPELLMDIIDPDELSRIEPWDDFNLVIMRLPVFNPNSDVSYTTTPLGAIIFPDKIITVCWTDCEVLRDLSANRIKGLKLSDFPAFIIRLLSRSDILFLRYLKEINRRTNSIQNELHESIENTELIQLLNMEKSLMFFQTSLKANQLLLEKIRRTKILKLDEDDQEWLDDVEIDNRQAMEMTDTYSAITAGTMDAFSNVISNNMNIVMKKLTVISLVLMIMSFITNFWGMNIRLPWSTSSSWTGFICLSILCVVSATVAYLVMNLKSLNRVKDKPAKRKRGRKH